MSEILRTVSAFAVIAGTVLVVLQVRVHARNANSRNAFDLIARVIDPSFARRRHQLYEVAENRVGGDWAGYDRSVQDFEVRNFANIYEQLGLLRSKGRRRSTGRARLPLGPASRGLEHLRTDTSPHHARGRQGVSFPHGRPRRDRGHLLAELQVARRGEQELDAAAGVGRRSAPAGCRCHRQAASSAPPCSARTRGSRPTLERQPNELAASTAPLRGREQYPPGVVRSAEVSDCQIGRCQRSRGDGFRINKGIAVMWPQESRASSGRT